MSLTKLHFFLGAHVLYEILEEMTPYRTPGHPLLSVSELSMIIGMANDAYPSHCLCLHSKKPLRRTLEIASAEVDALPPTNENRAKTDLLLFKL